jgi:2-amino-4-hydroxy-6-hydroxymethyldihydropteridine diphosphokinase
MDGPPSQSSQTQCIIALGGNLGDVAETFASALRELDASQDIRLGRTSQTCETRAVGPSAGGGFLNAAAELFTAIPPLELLARLQRVEAHHGRRRVESRESRVESQNRRGRVSRSRPSTLDSGLSEWGPRTIDLDLLLYGDRVIDSPELQVPHPGCWYRRFVLDPMAEIAAGIQHPVKQATFAELRSRLLPRPLPVGLSGGPPELRSRIAAQLVSEFPQVAFDGEWSVDDPPPALLAWLGASEGPPFHTLPLLPRLDVSASSDPLSFLRNVLQAALGE